MNPLLRIQQGESLPFKFDRGTDSIDGWTCTIEVKQYTPDVATISRVIPATGGEWIGFLTQSETVGLATGLWYLTATLVKLTTDELEQIPVRFSVSAKWN